MVRKIHKTNTLCILTATAIMAASLASPSASYAQDVDFRVKINEVLTVSLTTPDVWASGDVDLTSGSDVLLNKVTLAATSNNGNGFSAFMASKTTTNLVNSAKSSATIPTFGAEESGTLASFTNNRWGYTLDAIDDPELEFTGMSTSQIDIESFNQPDSFSQDIYFAAKAGPTLESGTYSNTVVFTVVSGTINTDPVDPVVPTDDTADDGDATYDSTNDRTIATTTSGTATTNTTTTQITSGNTTSSYTPPQGVTSTSDNGGGLATGLAVAAVAAAATGGIILLLAKRRDDDEEEEEEI